MLAWVANLGFAGGGVAVPPVDGPGVGACVDVFRPSPTSWATRWRMIGWIRLRLSLA